MNLRASLDAGSRRFRQEGRSSLSGSTCRAVDGFEQALFNRNVNSNSTAWEFYRHRNNCTAFRIFHEDGIKLQCVKRTRKRKLIAVFDHASDVKSERFLASRDRLLERAASRHTTGKVRKRDAVRTTLLMHQCVDEFAHLNSQPAASPRPFRLSKYGAECPDWNLSHAHIDRDFSCFPWMHKLNVVSGTFAFDYPSFRTQAPHDLARRHHPLSQVRPFSTLLCSYTQEVSVAPPL